MFFNKYVENITKDADQRYTTTVLVILSNFSR